jgi:hypothetical protein
VLPVEGAPLAVAGPYKVASGPAFGSPGHVVYRPADLAPFPGRGCAINSTRYAGFLTTIAISRFSGSRNGAASRRGPWAGSPLNGKIALDRIAVMGQSCGGFMALELGAGWDSRLPDAVVGSEWRRVGERRLELGPPATEGRPAVRMFKKHQARSGCSSS